VTVYDENFIDGTKKYQKRSKFKNRLSPINNLSMEVAHLGRIFSPSDWGILKPSYT